MQSSARRIVLSIGLSAASLTGCYSPYGYQSPYAPGYYGQPPYQTPQYPGGPVLNGPQGPVLNPDGTYAPGTSGPGGLSPTPLNNPGGNPPNTYDNGGNGINWETPNNSAPTFDPNPGGSSSGTPGGGNRGTVPDPVDDLNGSGPSANRPGLEPTSSARDNLQSPFGESSDAGAPSQPARVTSEPDLFEPPLQLNSEMTSGAAAIQTVSLDPSQNGKLNPYGRDTKHANPTWLRGVIDYDERDRSWSIVYAAAPNPRDPNGGSLTLANHPTLLSCRSGDVVLVEGAINAKKTDARGKPIYALDKVTQLTAE